MFADSPGLHGIEHPIYDIWLTDCKGGTTVINETPPVEASTTDTDVPADQGPTRTDSVVPGQAPRPEEGKPKPRRRHRRARPCARRQQRPARPCGGAASNSHGR